MSNPTPRERIHEISKATLDSREYVRAVKTLNEGETHRLAELTEGALDHAFRCLEMLRTQMAQDDRLHR